MCRDKTIRLDTMMKIHKTQNLNSLVQLNQQSANGVSSKDFRLKNYSEQMSMPKLSAESAELYGSSVSFGKSKTVLQDAKKIINMTKKKVGEIKSEPQLEKKKGDEFLLGSLFDNMLKVSNFGPITQAGLAAIVCTVLRPATIMFMPDKEGKTNNKYAAAHSISSGIAGFVLTTPLTYPFKQGGKYAQAHLIQKMGDDVLKRLYPHLNIESITDEAGKRLDKKFWKDLEGNKFIDDIKQVDMLPKFKHLADVSEKTFKDILKVDVDWAKYKGESFNDVKLRDGRSLYDAIDMKNIGIIIKEKGFGETQFLLRDLNHEYLEKLIKDSKDTNWGNLDINSVYADKKNNIVNDFRKWRTTDGKQWKLDLDEVNVASGLETADYIPRRTGKKRFDKKDKEYKLMSYLDNGKNGRLGTPINNDMVEADLANEGQMKLIEWLPDLAFRIPIAATTIAMIPWVLKKVFHLEKRKKPTEQKPEVQIAKQDIAKNEIKPAAVQQPAFRGKSKEPSAFVKWLGKTFGAWIIKNETIHKYAGKLAQLQGKLTAHMSTIGSLITSSVYVQQTLSKKDLDSEKRTTLAINQILCFFVPTFLAYTADSGLNSFVKNKEYRYSGLQRQKRVIEETKTGKPYTEEQLKTLSDKIKGIRVLASLLIFTTVYRYVSPVLITPFANKLGDWYNDRRIARKQAREIALNTENEDKAKEIALTPDINVKQSA